MIDALSISWQRCRGWWRFTLIAASLTAVALLANARAGAHFAEASQKRLARASELRRAHRDAGEQRARSEREQALAERLVRTPLAGSSPGAVEEFRRRLRTAGADRVEVTAGETAAAGAVGMVSVKIRAALTYEALRDFLAACEGSSAPIGWTRLSYDGTTFDAEIRVLTRTVSP